MELQKEFWDEFGSDLAVDGHGRVKFTSTGRDKYAPLFAKWGYVLSNTRTVTDFLRTLRRVQALEVEENNSKLVACLSDPRIPEPEKQFIRNVLGMVLPATAHNQFKAHAASGTASATAGSSVVYVDFQRRQVVHKR